jgi:hypothetical protein
MSESLGDPSELPNTPEGMRKLLEGAGLGLQQVSVEEFARAVAGFYRALKKEMPEAEERFLEDLTIAFVRRP